METNDLINVSLSYLVSVALVYVVLRAVQFDKPGIALATGAVVATNVAAWLYKRKRQAPASLRLRLMLGFLMAVLCVAESICFQIWLKWMAYPVTTIVVAAVGSFAFPPVLFEGFRRRLASGKRR